MVPASHLVAEPLVLRPWQATDVEAMSRAVEESVEHLRPWMPWVAVEPLSRAQRLDLIEAFGARWDAGVEFVYGMFLDGIPVGGCGLRTGTGDGALEIGYWVHIGHVGRGFATAAARRLTDAAFALAEVDRVEIHHDRANRASRRVPEKLAYEFVGERRDAITAPGEVGIDCAWRMRRGAWTVGGPR